MNKATLIRTIVLVFALLNQSLVLAGYSPLPFAESEVEAFVTGAFTVGATLWAYWKNNSITKEAQRADAYLNALKNEKGAK